MVFSCVYRSVSVPALAVSVSAAVCICAERSVAYVCPRLSYRCAQSDAVQARSRRQREHHRRHSSKAVRVCLACYRFASDGLGYARGVQRAD
uniref:Putative secreted protein n=1 Tax=Anopheles marajoara TaxID=58244 RepID=A0A2M4CAA1_9DIPT